MDHIRDIVLNNIPVGLMIIGGDGKIIEANPASCDILGCPVEGFVGKQWGEIFLSQERNLEFTEVVLDAIQKETPKIERVTPYYDDSGKKKFLSVISSAQREGGKISAIVVLIEDLTELHDLHEREKNILAQNHRLAEERANSLNLFAQSVAHQIRNPIMSIAGFARLLERRADEAAREPLEAIREEASKLETMVRAVAEYSAIRADAAAPVNLWVIIEEAKNLIANHPAVQGQGIVWKTDCPDMNITVDRNLMAQAISELLLNSAEFGGPGTRVRLCAKESDGQVVISVSDNGPGFSDTGLKMALDPFYTTKTVGAGMGLTRAKRIVVEHNGTITVDRTEDGGGLVRIAVPVRPMRMRNFG
ncbi:ATP-binding protein [Pseudodesulfovibrio sp. zrk46]|uniref:sensor histidine kinase n=1 Tax=Pseudodesulfovibrio sp. zrk46 TaxID=2725288 RepID=UPI001449265A|nr:ATP-binding protein [Pseudodesulfovibrio sp. zrk46]QJB55077.1 PAS domain S-box protein [Pseudodesulfovibrio sp. zrk46]